MRKQKNVTSEKDKSKKRGSLGTAIKIINFFMPYILSVLFVVVLFSLFGFIGDFTTKQGTTLNILADPLKGVFSIAGSAFFAILLLYHAIVWKYDLKHKICIRRVICSVVAVVSVSTIQGLIQLDKYPDSGITILLENGANGNGGGLVGGILARILNDSVTLFGGLGIAFVVLLFMLLQMFNITPFTMATSLFRIVFNKKDKHAKEKKEKVQEEKPKKGKKVVVYDDDSDTGDQRLEIASKRSKPAYLDLSQYINADQEQNSASVRETGYNSLDEQLINSRGTASSQLKPYNDGYTPASFTSNSSMVKTYDDDEDERIDNLRPISSYDQISSYNEPEDEIEYEEISSFSKTQDVNKKPTPAFEFIADLHSERGYKTQNEVLVDDEFEIEKHTVSISSFDKEEAEEYKAPVFEPEVEEVYTEPEIEKSYDEPEVEEVYAEPVVQKPVEDKYSYLDALVENAANKPQPKTTNLENESVAFDDASSYIPTREKPAEAKPKPQPPKKKPKRHYKLPPIQFLQEPIEDGDSEEAKAERMENARIIVDTLSNFNAKTRISDITRGPTVTRYELIPEAGVRVRSIANLADDIQLNLAAQGIRIECPIPGKSAVGIEVPNRVTSTVYLREIIDCDQFKKAKGKLTCALGKSISGENQYVDIEKTPHLLVAGATGMGKSVCINSLLVSLLYRTTPDDVRLILIDPKKVELSNYNGVPHLLVPVVCEPKKSLGALQWAVTEMDNRFEIIEAAGVRNLIEYNEKIDKGYEAEKMSRIVIVIDELADLKMTVPDIEGHITRLTQKARAAGIHVIIGTQRPSVDVITGLIKSNIPSRISFRVPSQIDSRTVLDEVGAEKLVSRGDMLVKLVGSLSPVRVQGSFVSADEIEQVINFWKENSPAIYDEEVMKQIDTNAAKLAKNDKDFDDGDGDGDNGELDPAFYDALELATEMGKISSSFLQRKLRLGFQRAARIIDQMEDCGYIGEANGSKPRDVLITKENYQEIMMRRNDE